MFQVVGVCSFFCCNGICKSGLFPPKTSLKWDTSIWCKGNIKRLSLVEFLSFLFCNLQYKWPNFFTCFQIWSIINSIASIWRNICSNIHPWALSVPSSSQFSFSFTLRKLFLSKGWFNHVYKHDFLYRFVTLLSQTHVITVREVKLTLSSSTCS